MGLAEFNTTGVNGYPTSGTIPASTAMTDTFTAVAGLLNILIASGTNVFDEIQKGHYIHDPNTNEVIRVQSVEFAGAVHRITLERDVAGAFAGQTLNAVQPSLSFVRIYNSGAAAGEVDNGTLDALGIVPFGEINTLPNLPPIVYDAGGTVFEVTTQR